MMPIVLVTVFTVISHVNAYGVIKDWDHFTFTQSWPQTVCIMKETGQQCVIPPRITSFVIHGLWPSKGNTKKPVNCSNQTFDPNSIKNLTNELNNAWPNLYKTKDKYEFWMTKLLVIQSQRHEWSEHGTCAVSINATGTEYLYFRKTLDLMQTFNATKYLNAENIFPSDEKNYSTDDIAKILFKEIGNDVDLQCYPEQNLRQSSNKNVLAEIRICMDKKFNVISCKNFSDSNMYFRTKKNSDTEPCAGTLIFPEIRR